jgi:hypothetical protein
VLGSASYGDDESLIAGDVIASYFVHDRAVATTGQHPRNEPRADIGREVTDNVAARSMYPDTGVIRPRRIGYENELITLVQPMHDISARAENRPVDGCSELLCSR